MGETNITGTSEHRFRFRFQDCIHWNLWIQDFNATEKDGDYEETGKEGERIYSVINMAAFGRMMEKKGNPRARNIGQAGIYVGDRPVGLIEESVIWLAFASQCRFRKSSAGTGQMQPLFLLETEPYFQFTSIRVPGNWRLGSKYLIPALGGVICAGTGEMWPSPVQVMMNQSSVR